MTIAIIAHNGKKAEMVQFLNENKEILLAKEINLIATGNTGNKTEAAGFTVEKLHSGPLGGDAQIASRVVDGNVDMIIFFRDPLDKHPHEPDIFMLMRLCDVYNIPLATNPATASLLIKAL